MDWFSRVQIGRTANDQAVLDRFCEPKADSRGIDCAAIASRSGALQKPRRAQAHAVFDRSCAEASVMIGSDAAERACNSGKFAS